MTRLWWIVTLGLCCWSSVCHSRTAISCRFKGVFHVEKNGRYKLTREEGTQLCSDLNSTLATMEDMQIAYDSGFETCRYGWIEEHIVIPRITPNPICAANHTGIYILTSNITQHYDAYCFNASETRDKVCDSVIVSDDSLFPQKSIPSYDPSLQETQLNPAKHDQDSKEDSRIELGTPTDPGYATGTPQPGGTYDHDREIWESTPDPQVNPDQEIPLDNDINESTEQPGETNVHSGDHELPGSNEDQQSTRDPDKEDEETYGGVYPGDKGHEMHEDHTSHPYTQSPDVPEDHGDHGGHHGGHHGSHGDDTTETSSRQPDDDDDDENRVHPEAGHGDSRGVPNSTDSSIHPHPEHGAHPGEHDGENHSDSGIKGRASDRTSLQEESTDANKPKQKRGAIVPDWLIVMVALICLGLILSVCLALNTRRLCGQKKKLVINGKKTSLEDGEIMEHDGDTAKTQEMVQLVSRDQAMDPAFQSDTMTQEDMRNVKNTDKKISV
ncbi:CD44 antigen [Rhinophrynus dorsalis]